MNADHPASSQCKPLQVLAWLLGMINYVILITMPSLAASLPRYDPQHSVNSMEINKHYGRILRK